MSIRRDNPKDEREIILGTRISRLTWDLTVQTIVEWAQARTSRYVCVSNVHAVVTARSDDGLRAAINGADMATPDGMPLAWLISRRRKLKQERISGADLTVLLCDIAAQGSVKIGFYGSGTEVLKKLELALRARFPQLQIACMISPPYRALSSAEDAAMVRQLNNSGAGIVFVGLGCPKQEIWMAAHRGQVNAVMIGVGAAFDYLAGTVKRPPVWMQRAGLEWLGRLIAEPRRLWRRYFVTNTVFLLYILGEVLGVHKPPPN